MIVTQALHRLPRWLPRVFLANALMASALFGPVDWATTSSLAEEGGGSRLDTNTPETNYVSVQSAQDAALFGTISGVVFRDYNGNGLQGTNDLGIAGVIITATDNSIPAQTVSTVTLNDGSYTLPQLAGTQARVIFSLPPSLSFLRPGMPTVGSSVRFVDISAGNATSINMSYNNPDEYCQANPLIILNTFRNGTSVGNASAGCVSFAYDVADGSPNDTGGDVPIQYGIPALPGTAANPRVDAQLQQIGSTWGIAHQHIPLRVFLSSFVRRHVGLGPRGEDGVYVIDYSNSAAASVVGGFDVQGVAPRNGGALIDVGTVTRTGSSDYVLGATSTSNVDLDAFDKMGKVSFGDTDIGEDGKTLWMVNLNQRGLIQVDLSNYTPSMANPSFLPTNVISQYLLSPALGEPTCVGGVFRPWALKFKDQRGYLGGVCSGEVSQQITDVVAYVLSFDPQNAGLGFSTVLSVSMNYTRENNMNGLGFLPERWHAWASTWAETGLPFPNVAAVGPDSGAYGQPILSDIEFTENGSIVLGFSDRFGHQTGYDQYIPMPSADTLYGGFTSVSSGDILQVCRTASGYVMEGGVGCATGEVAGGSRRVDDGPNGSGEFYYQDTYITNGANGNTAPTHDETTLGGLLWLPGSGQVASTVFDPVDYPVSTSPSNRGLNTVGVHWYNNRTGSKDDGYLVSSTGSKSGMGKATSLGDMDLLCDPAPISVGNRVWVDSNQDGIQDPAELGLAGVTVQLVDNSGAVISTTTTNNTGDYSFNGLSFNSAYTIQIPIAQSALAAYTMTLPNATGIVSNDWITDILDSDGQLLGGAIAIPFMTGDAGENNYSFDFGVRLLTPNIAMSKHTNGSYAPTGTGPQLLVGSTVTWTYVVTNTGEVTLTNFTLTDDRQGAINTNNCAPNPSPNFAPNAVTTCQITGTVTQGQYTNTANIVAANIFSASQQVSSTSVSHYLGLLPQLAILKLTNGSDADNAPGLIVAAGSTVTWTYLVTNTGNVTLSNVAVNDDQIGAVNCPANTLNPNASMTCLATGIAISGQYTNVGTASGTTPTGLSFTSTVTATNPSHYFGVNPSMALTKLTNGVYTTSGTGPVLSIGAAVSWTYVVTNTGNVSLTNIALSDDREGAITCPQSSLNVGSSMTCVRTGTVITGQYLNNATLSASNPLSNSGNITPTVTVTSASRYLGVSVGLQMTKLTNGVGDTPQDADNAPGPLVGMGRTVTWTYIVTNTGSVTLTSVSLVDDQLGAVSCPSTTLNPQTTMTCVATGVAIAGQYTNVATATGAPPSGLGLPTTITATNPSHYFGVNPSMALTKLTNGVYTTSGTGPVLSIGAAVSWTYVVTNTGNVSLTNIALSDDREGAISCPQSSLNIGASMTCVRVGTVITGQYINNATISAGNPLSNSGNITPTVTATSASRYLGVSVGLQMTKLTNGTGDTPQDADGAPGPLVGMGQAVTWTYIVTNTGSVTLTSVSLVDDQLGSVSCPSTTLNPQTAMTCVATGVAIAGQYTNVATVTGAPPSGLGLPTTITATNPSHYFGVNPSMALTKLTNGVYTTTGTGPVLSIGAAVTWTYVVTNTGNVSLTNIALSDDREGTITCPQSSLNVGASMTCVRTGTVITGQYINNATISAGNPLSNSGNITPTVTVTSASRYLGINAAIQVIKFTNGAGDVPQDADGMPGPLIGAGRAVTWTYWVTNTGTITLSNIILSDDRVGTVNCPANSLAPSAGMVCMATGVAIAGQYTNTATVSGATPAGLGAVFTATASNPSHYFGVDPRFVVTKLTNGVSAQSGNGPLIGAGALVTWTYIVTNIGNVTLTNIALNDDRVGVITCPSAVLAVASVMTCSATGVAVTGQYVNNVFVTATHPFTNAGNITPTVTMTDSSRYFGVNPSVTIVKLTNGPASPPADADVVPGPTITAGLPVTWTYRITNTGNVTLTNLSVGDNREGVITPTLCTPSLVGLQLAPGAGVVCNLVGVARAGQYSNTGMVTATNAMSNNGQITPTVTANNLSHYLGVQPPADNSAIAGLGDYVWVDVNHNGVQDADEVGLGDVIVRLRNADTNAELAVTRTNASGYYSFTNLNTGRYMVQFVLPAGYSFTLQGASNIATNSDADTVTGLTAVYTLTTGQYIPTIDAGVWQPMTIGNYVWHDANNDSAVNANELGFRNVLLELYEDTNKDGMFELGTDRMLLSTQTDNNGRYQFTNLVPGSYFVILPAANFVAGANLASLYPSTAAVSSSSNQDSRNHGVAVGVLGNDGYVVATIITLVNNQLPTTDGDTNTNTNMSIDFGLNDQNPTAVSLMAFHSQRQASGRIDVSWVTGQEVDTYGFVLYRSEGMATSTTMPANAVKVTDQIILGKGRGQGGASYEWADYSAQLGKTYTYWLVEIETSGNENHYGPAAPSFKGGSRVLLPLLMTSKR